MTTTASGDGLAINGIHFGYGSQPVLSDISVRIPRGQVLAMMGPSGCGKTTLGRIVAGFLVPPRAPSPCTAPRWSVRTVGACASATHRHGAPRRRAFSPFNRRRQRWIWAGSAITRTAGSDRRMPCSRGTRGVWPAPGTRTFRRPTTASCGCPSPRATPRSDHHGRAVLGAGHQPSRHPRDLVFEAIATQQTTVMLITHDGDEALSSADQIALIANGRITQIGSPDDIYLRPVGKAAAATSGPIVELSAHADGASAATAIGPVALRNHAAGTGSVIVRPEQIVLRATRVDAAVATVTAVHRTGATLWARCTLTRIPT